MTRQQIMVRAHEIARHCEGDYQVRLALGLRQAWLEARLLKIGSEWQKGGHHRIYINGLERWYGLELDHYKTGHVSAATFRGERISNGQAGRIAARLAGATVYYDMAALRFTGKGIDVEDLTYIVNTIKAHRAA